MTKRILLVACLFLVALSAFAPVLATVSTTANRVTYAGNGATVAFSFPYKFLSSADLVVVERTVATNSESVRTLTTHYTVTGAGVDAGGTVTMLTAPATGVTLVIYRDPAKTQDLDLKNNQALPMEQLEKRLDKLTLMVQRLEERANRSIHMSDGNPTTFDMTLPNTLTSSSVVTVNADGDGLELSTLSASAADLSALTGGGSTGLHFHDSDRSRPNHTGTQLRSTILDLLPITSADVLDGTLVSADLSASAAIPYSKLSLTGAIVSADIVNGTIVGDDVLDGTLDSSDLSASAGIVSGQILNSTLLYEDIQDQDAGTLLGRGSDQGTGPPQPLSIGAGLTSAGGILSAAGGAATITIQEGGLTEGSGSFNTVNFADDDFDVSESPASAGVVVLATNAVESTTIQDDTVVNGDINSAAAIAYAKLNLVASILNADISGSAAIAYSKLAFSNNIVAGDLAVDSVAASEIAANAVDTSEIAANAVDTSEIVGGAPGASGAELANTTTNLSGDHTMSPAGDEFILPTGKYPRITGSSANPPSNGGWNYDTDDLAFSFLEPIGKKGLVGVLFALTSDAAGPADSTTEAEFSGSDFDVPANAWSVGKSIRMNYGGVLTAGTNASQTIQLRVRFGSTSLVLMGPIAYARGGAQTDRPFSGSAVITCRTTGAAGTFQASGNVVVHLGDSPADAAPDRGAQMAGGNAAVVIGDTTGILNINTTGKFGVNSGTTESWTMKTMVIEGLR